MKASDRAWAERELKRAKEDLAFFSALSPHSRAVIVTRINISKLTSYLERG